MTGKISVYTDGGSRGNPGLSAIGIVFADDSGKVFMERKESIGIGTNNRAEYKALIKAMGLALKHNLKNIVFHTDSKLVCGQMAGGWKVKEPKLKILHASAKELEREFDSVEYRHVPRENNFIKIADRLVNEALDEQRK